MTPGPAAISTRSAVCALEAVRSRLAGRGRITTARLCACPPHPRKPCCDLGRAWYGPGAALVAGDMAVTVRPGGARIGVLGMILTASPPAAASPSPALKLNWPKLKWAERTTVLPESGKAAL